MNLFQTVAVAVFFPLLFLKVVEAMTDEIVEAMTDDDSKIVGGSVAMEGRYPYQVSLGGYCGAFLIAPDLVLSAAHCAGGGGGTLYVGAYDLSTDTRRLVSLEKSRPLISPERVTNGTKNQHPIRNQKIDNLIIRPKNLPPEQVIISSNYREIIHPLYNSATYEYDQMIIKLDNPINSVVPVNVDDGSITDFLMENDDLQVIGWGTTSSSGIGSDILMEVTVGFVPNDTCDAAYGGSITEDMMCAASPGKDSCQGDSGGPLISLGDSPANDAVVGIVSWGSGCADPNYPGVYSRIAGSTFITDALNGIFPVLLSCDNDDVLNAAIVTC